MLPLGIVYYFVYAIVVVCLLILLYHAFDEYKVNDKFCITGSTVSKTGGSIKKLFKWNKEALTDVPTDGVNFQQDHQNVQQSIPAPATMYTKPSANAPVEPVVTLDGDESPQPNIETSAKSNNFTDALLEMAIDDSMRAQHEKYVEEADFGSNRALFEVEREPVDVIPWVGLRRVNYAAVPVSEGARTISSVTDLGELPKPNKIIW